MSQQTRDQDEMSPQPDTISHYQPADKLKGKVAIITGGDSGIGRAVAVMFAMEGANVAISYLEEHGDAQKTREMVEAVGRECLLFPGDIYEEVTCKRIVDRTYKQFGKIDILVNNAGQQERQEHLTDITRSQWEKTFQTNIFAMFCLTKSALAVMKKDGVIINTASVTAYRGSPKLIDYSSSKGAIVSFTRSLALSLASKGIRVNAVAPGPIWTPLITSTFPKEEQEKFGKDTPLGRAGQPSEVAPCYVFLASNDSSYMTGQVLHPNGGEIING